MMLYRYFIFLCIIDREIRKYEIMLWHIIERQINDSYNKKICKALRATAEKKGIYSLFHHAHRSFFRGSWSITDGAPPHCGHAA